MLMNLQLLFSARHLRLNLPRWLRLVALWQSRYQQRRALARLDARLRDDIGVTRGEAAREAAKPFWR